MDVPLPLVTPRLTLRPYESGDLDALHDLFGREDVVRYVPWEPMGLDRARELLERRLRQTRIDADGDGIVLAAVETETGAMVGEFGLWVSSLEHRQGVVGWAIHPDRQGRGLATEGAEELLRVGFEVLDMHRIIADSDPRNTPSLR
ncbi:MAG TPA: GNAT family N-acetyltransferase, partial [Actinomycetes bacterium]|nr:GNAT family N-acetyltransferase [Actinomycetes bacterium]